jgi:hypothetical protein
VTDDRPPLSTSQSFHPFSPLHSFPTPRLVVQCVKWGDRGIKGCVTNPFGVPPPRTLATYIMQGRRTRRQRSCVQFTNIRDVSEPGSIDPASLEVYSSHLHPDLPNGYIQHKTSRQLPFLPRKYCVGVPPRNPYMPCARPVITPITHAWTHPRLAFYCSPSGLSELLPARRISSVDNRLMAITELRHHAWQEKGVWDF